MNFEHYIELMYSKDSEYNKIENLEERKRQVMQVCNMDTEPNSKEYRMKVVEFLSRQHHNKFSLLRTREDMLQEALASMREPLVNTTDEDKKLKNVKLKLDLDVLAERLLTGIDSLRKEIYKPEVMAEAEEMIVSVVTPEMRLKKMKNGSPVKRT